ncbi:cathepsin B-like [Sitophilus oryzae]|uniref:Cathepsin B-like n=1 Tax=Sitophilus oryzae TaxID=7048 RepID=A0A6J2YET6_SITOR|nr:cathepsin B-like [Sitophilus oryzae]
MNLISNLVLLVSFSVVFAEKLHPLSDEFIAEINSKQSTWKAGRYFDVEDYELAKILATGSKGFKNPENITVKVHDENKDIPESFDARDAWPECAGVIGLIRDQSQCGSCWAFSAAEAMSDRICIHSDAERKTLVSAQDILTCTVGNNCKGGWVENPWFQWNDTGYVTGGLYNRTDQGCKSYFLPSCEDHPHKCIDYVDSPDCIKQCDDTSLDYLSEHTYGLHPNIFVGETQMQLEILKNGPLATSFSVYADFLSYQSGIYQHVSGDFEGSHAVKIIGWGVENDVKYWLIANSWNENWGENGYFRFLRGSNECAIEAYTIAGLPDFTKF